ncbi:hypothetical protein [Neobacillus dielmonensis]|uniref:hypothetical protein n=1 Tax=Neobacillus dielmonensis TaxID=1347369 RepID=UPI000AAEC480|nr:hypothetical protein [Neobacillus dielmonensis]
MADYQNPVEFTGKVLDQRNNLTGPDDSGRTSHPEQPKHVDIQQTTSKKEQV